MDSRCSWSFWSHVLILFITTVIPSKPNFLRLNMKPLTNNRLVLLQIDYGSYGRKGLKPTTPLTTNDNFRKIVSSALTLNCLFKVNKAWGTVTDKHFYFLTKSIIIGLFRSSFDLHAGQIFCFHFWNSSIQPEKSHAKLREHYHLPRSGSHLEVNCDNRM